MLSVGILASLDEAGTWTVAVIGGIATLGGALAWVSRRAYRTARTIEAVWRLVEHELKPNSGASLRDAVDRSVAASRAAQQTAERAHRESAATREALDAHLRAADEDRAAAREEAQEMWRAIRAIARSHPIEEGT